MQEKIHITSKAIHSDSPQLLVGSLLHLWYISRIRIVLYILPHLGYSSKNLPNLPPLLSFHVTTSFFICTLSIYSAKIFKEGKLWGVHLLAIFDNFKNHIFK